MENSKVTLNLPKIIEIALYILGAISIIIAFKWYANDLDISSSGNPFDFHEESYVGGDAYNYIISAARSSAIVIKSLIWMVLGCSAIITGRLTAIISKKSM